MFSLCLCLFIFSLDVPVSPQPKTWILCSCPPHKLKIWMWSCVRHGGCSLLLRDGSNADSRFNCTIVYVWPIHLKLLPLPALFLLCSSTLKDTANPAVNSLKTSVVVFSSAVHFVWLYLNTVDFQMSSLDPLEFCKPDPAMLFNRDSWAGCPNFFLCLCALPIFKL